MCNEETTHSLIVLQIRQEFYDVARTRVQLLQSWQHYKELILQLAASNAGMQHLLEGIVDMDEGMSVQVFVTWNKY